MQLFGLGSCSLFGEVTYLDTRLEDAQVPSPESNARIVVPASCKCGLDFLPFLGKVRRIEGKAKGDRLVFKLPAFDRGSVAWIENTK